MQFKRIWFDLEVLSSFWDRIHSFILTGIVDKTSKIEGIQFSHTCTHAHKERA